MKIGLYQLDGKIPNIALMRLAAHHRAMGNSVQLVRAGNEQMLEHGLFETFDRIYGSMIFERRWVIGAYDKTVSWKDWSASRYEPRNLDLDRRQGRLPILELA